MPNFKVGEEVIVYQPEYKFAVYDQQSRYKGRLIRPHAPVGREKYLYWKVELYGTASQDTEGHNITVTVHEKAMRRIKK